MRVTERNLSTKLIGEEVTFDPVTPVSANQCRIHNHLLKGVRGRLEVIAEQQCRDTHTIGGPLTVPT